VYAHTLAPPVVSSYDVQIPEWSRRPMTERMAEARKLMQEAGYGPNKPLEIDFRYDTSESGRRQVVAFSAMWRPLGVKVNALDSDFITLNKAARTADSQVLRYAWFAPNNDPDTFLGLFSSTNPNNYSGYKNPEFDALYRRGNASLDPGQRMRQLSDAEALALADQPVIPVYHFTPALPGVAGRRGLCTESAGPGIESLPGRGRMSGKSLSLVLGSGGARGLAHIGVIEVPRNTCLTCEFYRARDIIAEGRRQAERALREFPR
jgi:ABC-type transport system substrate-binding protein